MAKDPAFLFYPNDYLGGTTGMTLEEKGGYMELLVMQFNKGAFTKEQARKLLNGHFDQLWDVLKEKFVEVDGKFFNERLEKEKDRRNSFISKQKEIGKKGGRPKTQPLTQTKPNPFENSNPDETNKENENENINHSSFEKSEKLLIVPEMLKVWKKEFPDYFEDQDKDFEPLLKISGFICKLIGLSQNILKHSEEDKNKILIRWGEIVRIVSTDNFFRSYSITQVEKHFQSILKRKTNGFTTTSTSNTSARQQANTAAATFIKNAVAKVEGITRGV